MTPAPASAPVRLRERKKLGTRRALEEAALDLFAARGFDGVTVEEIAAAAGVSSRTFFRYFGAKEDVVLGPLLAARDALRDALAATPADAPVLDALRGALERLAAHLAVLGPDVIRRVAVVRATPVLAARLVQVREEWRALLLHDAAARLGVDPAVDLRPHAAAAWAMAGLSAARELWEHDPSARDLPSLLAQAYELLRIDPERLAARNPGRTDVPR